MIKRFFKHNTFQTAYIGILIPVIVAFLFSVFSISSYRKNNMEMLKTIYADKLSTTYYSTEQLFTNTIKMVRMLSENSAFISAISGNSDDFNPDTDIYTILPYLKQIKSATSEIDNIMIVNRSLDLVYGTMGTSTIENYFSQKYQYQNYDFTFWNEYKMPIPEYVILAPSSVMIQHNKSVAIPIVFSKLGDVTLRDLLIVNINLSQLLSRINENPITPNSQIRIINNTTMEAFSHNSQDSEFLSEDFLSRLLLENNNVFNYEDNMVITYSPLISTFSYTYAATIPKSDIRRSMPSLIPTILFGIFSFIIILALSYANVRNIYTPIKKIVTSLGRRKYNLSEPISALQDSISDLQSENQLLSQKIANTLPIAQERYLIKFLNSNIHYMPSDKDDINSQLPSFKYEYFCSIIMKILPTDNFYNEYDNTAYHTIQDGIYTIIKNIFNEQFETYVIASEADTLYVLLNLEAPEQHPAITQAIEQCYDILMFDSELITLYSSNGNIYKDLTGLKKSHLEALSSITNKITLEEVKIQLEKNPDDEDLYLLSSEDINELSTMLMIGNIDQASSFINDIVSKNVKNSISSSALKKLYAHILKVILKAIKLKDINSENEDEDESAVISEIVSQEPAQIHNSITKYLNRLHECIKKTDKVDISIIVFYIKEHYTEDIYLESVADVFKISPKYLSSKMKKIMGINFSDYVSHLRIEKAKDMLQDNSKTIKDIYESVGFHHRNTFIRTFKSIVGETPSEYRSSLKS